MTLHRDMISDIWRGGRGVTGDEGVLVKPLVAPTCPRMSKSGCIEWLSVAGGLP